MLSFVQSWFAPTANPIGVDFGSDGLRMAQVDFNEAAEPRLVAAARSDVPAHVRNDPAAKIAFFADAARDMMAAGSFRGRRVVLSLPSSVMCFQHLRVPKMEEAALKQSLAWECRGKLPYDPSHALLRHIVAGDVFAEGEQRHEVIVMAAQREWVNQFLAAAARAKLDVVGMNVEAKALIDCFSHVYRRKSDTQTAQLFVDIGASATRAIVACGGQILFVRAIPIGGDQFTRAAAKALGVNVEDAEILRIKLCHQQSETELARQLGGNAVNPSSDPSDGGKSAAVEQAYTEPLQRLISELALCRRYHEATFPSLPIERLIFVGGEARHRMLCQRIAQGLDLAAQVGDPMVRMARETTVGPESGIDRRLPQPDWAVALGLSLGPMVNAKFQMPIAK